MSASTKLHPQSLRSDVFRLVGVGFLAISSVAIGACKKSEGSAPTFKVVTSTQTLDVLKAGGVPVRPGQRAIAAAPMGKDQVVLLDGGGPRYVVVGPDLIEVCPTAGSIATHEQRIAVGCGPLGSDPPRVQIIEGNAVASTIAFDTPASNSLAMRWPVVDATFERAAVPSADHVVVAQLDDPSSHVAVGSVATTAEVTTLEFSPSSKRVAIGRADGSVELYAFDQEAVTTLAPKEPDQGCAIAFSPHEDRVAVASFWGRFRLYSLEGKLLASDSTKQGQYGHNDVTFVGDRILQIEAGALVVRNLEGRRLSTAAAADTPKPFAPADLGALGFVTAAHDRGMITIDGVGLTATLSSFSP